MTVTTDYRVEGMTCDHCVRAVTEELGTVAGISEVRVALASDGPSTVTVTSATAPDDAAVAAAVEEAGYELVR